MPSATGTTIYLICMSIFERVHNFVIAVRCTWILRLAVEMNLGLVESIDPDAV